MYKIENLFPTKIYRTKYPGIQELIVNLLPKLEDCFNPDKSHVLMSEECITTYSQNRQVNTWPETQDLVNFLNVHIKNYWKELNYQQTLEPYIIEMWANKSTTGGWIYHHTHTPNPIVGTCYLSVSPTQGNLFFQDPLEMVKSSQPCNIDQFDEFEQEVPLEVGDIVLFPGYLRHRTYPNQSTEPRIVLSFNIGCSGQYITNQWINK